MTTVAYAAVSADGRKFPSQLLLTPAGAADQAALDGKSPESPHRRCAARFIRASPPAARQSARKLITRRLQPGSQISQTQSMPPAGKFRCS